VPGSTTGRCSLFSYLAMERLGLDLCELSAEQLYGADATCSQFVDHGLQMLQVSSGLHAQRRLLLCMCSGLWLP
jgi:hypothetical protein